MKTISLILFILMSAFIPLETLQAEEVTAQATPIDLDQIVGSVRKVISVPPNWNVKITSLRSSGVPGLFEGVLELSFEKTVRQQTIYISTDGKNYILGNMYDATVNMDEERWKRVTTKNSPSKGNPDAPVKIVEFSELQCAACKNAHDQIKKDKLVESYNGKVQLIFKNYPLSEFHKWAAKGSVAALCGNRQDPKHFWGLVEDIFAVQTEITPENLDEKVTAFAQARKLDMKKFKDCYDKQLTLEEVNRDLEEGKSLGIGSTPTFLINGRAVVGFRTTAELRLFIEEFLPKKQ